MPQDNRDLSIRPFRPSDWKIYRELRLGALADSPDAFGSTLAVERARTEAQWAGSLVAASTSGLDLPLAAFVGTEPAGLAWARAEATDASAIHLFQMWVAPGQRGRGIGRALLRTAIQWARDREARTMLLGATCGDTAAVRLYASEGFQPVGMPRPLRPGSPILAQDMRLDLPLRGA